MTNLPIPISANCLIIDGDRYASETMENCLTELPWITSLGSVADASGAREVLSKIKHLDVIVLGTGYHNLHAFEIASEFRDHVKCMVFIGDDNESALKAFQVGGDHFLHRPLNKSKFSSTVGSMITKTLHTKDITISDGYLWIPVQLNNYKN